jgi:hypothetical protein
MSTDTTFSKVQKQQLSVSLIWLIVAGSFGLLLRWHFVQPIPDFPFAWWRHAHSHLGFLGWIGNVLLSLLLFSKLIPRFFHRLWWFSQLLILGMAISFPLSGYSTVSIVFSTSHIVCCWLFAGWWFSRGRKNSVGTIRQATDWALALMSVSQLGPIGLGMSMALAPQNTALYSFFLHFYLYFQHSGWFIMGALAVFLKYHNVTTNNPGWDQLIRWTGYYILLYFSAAYVNTDLTFVRLLLAAASIYVAFQLIRRLPVFWRHLVATLNNAYLKVLGNLIVFCWGLKLLLELSFLVPAIAADILPNRFLMLGFLHLNFLGISSPLLLLLIFKYQTTPALHWPVILYRTGSLLTIIFLFVAGYATGLSTDSMHIILFAAAGFTWLAQLLFGFRFVKSVSANRIT